MRPDDDFHPEGLVIQPTGYTLDLDGNINLAEFGLRLGYDLLLKLDGTRPGRSFMPA